MAAQLARSAWKIVPMFHSRSIAATLDFYVGMLGFELGGVKPEDVADDGDKSELFFCSVAMGKQSEANIYFFKVASQDFHPSRAMIALGTTQLDDYYTHLKSLPSIDIAEAIEDMPWGYRQFSVKDPDGNMLTFFKFLEGGNPGPE